MAFAQVSAGVSMRKAMADTIVCLAGNLCGLGSNVLSSGVRLWVHVGGLSAPTPTIPLVPIVLSGEAEE